MAFLKDLALKVQSMKSNFHLIALSDSNFTNIYVHILNVVI